MPWNRQDVACLLLRHASRLGVTVEPGPGSYRYRMGLVGETYVGCVLVRSRDYWEKGLQEAAALTLLVVRRHDSCVPLSVLDLERGYLYRPYETPPWYSPHARLTSKTAPVFWGQLLAGVDEAYQRLSQLPRSTRARYLARLRALLRPVGRPLRA
jgi:hypothetical protein